MSKKASFSAKVLIAAIFAISVAVISFTQVSASSAAGAETPTNPSRPDSFSAILLVAVASSAMLGFGLATKSNRR